MEIELEQVKNDHLHQKTTKFGDAKFRVAEFKGIDADGVEFIFRMRAREHIFEKKFINLPLSTGLLINVSVNIPLTFISKPPELKAKEKRLLNDKENLEAARLSKDQKSLDDVLSSIDDKINES